MNVLLSISVKEPISVSLALDRYGLLKEDDFQMPDTSLHGPLVQHFGSSHSASDIKRRSPFLKVNKADFINQSQILWTQFKTFYIFPFCYK